MTIYTVQCGYAAYNTNTVTVEAEGLMQALGKAIAEANQSPSWFSTDYSGPTFVTAAAEGKDVDLWKDESVRPLPIPSRFREHGEGPRIVITVEGGVIQHVDIEGGIACVEVRDYDTHGITEANYVRRDPDGTPYLVGIWSNRIEDSDANPASGQTD
jgi:hypothetical protein